MSFFVTLHCESRAHCRTCRNRHGGADWRRAMDETFGGVGQAGADFKCPFGLPWLMEETFEQFPAVELPLPKNMKSQISQSSLTVRRIGKHCQTCGNFKKHRCILYRGGHTTACEFAAYLNRPGAICPAGKF